MARKTNDTYIDIVLSHNAVGPFSSYNIVKGNMILALETNKTKYGIRESVASCDYNLIANNIVQGAVTANISLQGANSVNDNNIA